MLSIARQTAGIVERSVFARGFSASAVTFAKKRDPNLPVAPKGSPSSYALYVKDRFSTERDSFLSTSQPGKIDLVSASAKISEEWTNLDESAKAEYTAKAKELKKAYDAEYKKWYDSLDKETIKAIEKSTGKKVSLPGGKGKAGRTARAEEARLAGQPPMPLTAFFEYMDSFRNGDGKGLGVVEVAKRAGEEWNKMVEEEKQKFKDVAADKKTKYLEWKNSQAQQ